jgi:anti-sigma B factor antagonist
MPTADRPNLKLEPTDTGVLVHLVDCGVLNDVTTPAIDTQLQSVADEVGAASVTLDLGGVTYASSSALAMCLGLCHKLRDAGGQLTLCGLCEHVYEVFDVTGLTRVLNVRRKT